MNLPTDIAPSLMALRYAPGQVGGQGTRDDDDARGRLGAGGFASSFAATLEKTSTETAPAAETGGASGTTGFDDLIDVINPLQHVPVLSSLYRSATDDAISAPARLLGGALFGGPIGFGLAVANVVTEGLTGEDIGEHVIAAITPDTPRESGPTALAADKRPETDITAASNAGDDATYPAADEAAAHVLSQHIQVKEWAETEMRLRAEATRARSQGTHAGLRQADAFVENALLSGAMKTAMREYDQLATTQRRADHMAMEMDLEG